MGKFVIEPHFRLQEWVAEEKGYFTQEGLDYVFRELVQSTDGRIHDSGAKVGAYQSLEAGRAADVSCACHWTVGVAASAGHGKLYPGAYSVAPAGIFVPAESPVKAPDQLAGVPHLGRLPVRQPLLDDPGARAISPRAPDQAVLQRRHAVSPGCERLGARRRAVQRTVLLRRAARLPQDHRHLLHDHDDDPRPAGPRGSPPLLPGASAAKRDIHVRPTAHPLLPERVPRPLPPIMDPAGGARASARGSSPTRRKSSTRPSSGSPSTGSSRTAAWARASTSSRSRASRHSRPHPEASGPRLMTTPNNWDCRRRRCRRRPRRLQRRHRARAAGRRVLLLEREPFPRFHIGESQLPWGNEVFRAAGRSRHDRAGGIHPEVGGELPVHRRGGRAVRRLRRRRGDPHAPDLPGAPRDLRRAPAQHSESSGRDRPRTPPRPRRRLRRRRRHAPIRRSGRRGAHGARGRAWSMLPGGPAFSPRSSAATFDPLLRNIAVHAQYEGIPRSGTARRGHPHVHAARHGLALADPASRPP